MTDLDRTDDDEVAADDEPRVDGRVARRQRNIDAVIDVVLDMFGEELLFPTMEQAATRSGLSLRSLYRYFADPGELLEAAITRSRERGTAAVHLHSIGQGSFERRLQCSERSVARSSRRKRPEQSARDGSIGQPRTGRSGCAPFSIDGAPFDHGLTVTSEKLVEPMNTPGVRIVKPK